MLKHDVSPEYFGLVHFSQAERFRLEEAKIDPMAAEIRPTDLIISFIHQSMHGSAHLSHLGQRLIFSERDTQTSNIYSIMDRGLSKPRTTTPYVTSIIVPHNNVEDRLGEGHRHDIEVPKPLARGDYVTLKTVFRIAKTALELSR